MSTTPTTYYSFLQQDDYDTNWGDITDANWVLCDTALKAVSDVADAALPATGGTMTGQVDLFTSTAALKALGDISGNTSCDLLLGNVFSATVLSTTTFTFDNAPSGTWMTGFILYLTDGGSNVSWPVTVAWPSGVAPTLASSGTDILVFTTIDDGVTWHGVLASGDSQ
jgi:hypothetical protein